MSEIPYLRFDPASLILRDHLAIDRTILANERTLLAYLRTALALVITGASFLKFFNAPGFHLAGWILLPLALALMLYGCTRFVKIRADIQSVRRRGGEGANGPVPQTPRASAGGNGGGQ